MNPKSSNKLRATLPLVRCAIYTRKSTEEGLQQAFNTLDAQRESGEAYVASQQHEGWTCLPERYDDGGFSGGSMDRPALQRLLKDIEAGKVDCVVVYKVDRLSRSLLDFARMMQTFEQHRVSFVSVTQQFNTATSMGRLVLNVLLSFAQFEREIISERTRDKIAATRRRGKWCGGMPLLGYDVGPQGSKLLINEAEAVQVRAIFELYLEYQSLLPVVQELERRGWVNKRWTTRAGHERGGKPFTRTCLHRLLTNVAYTGKVRYKDEVHDGEQPAIVDAQVWQRVQTLLHSHGSSGPPIRNQFRALLQGLLRCTPCGCAMTPTHTTRKGNKRYHYYVCVNAQKRGYATCPSRSLPAAEVEGFVVDQIQCIGKDPALQQATLTEARQQNEARLGELDAERRALDRDLTRCHGEMKKLTGQFGKREDHGLVISRLADLQERISQVEQRLAKVREQVHATRQQRIDDEELATALSVFDPVWEALSPRERTRIVQLLVERVDYDGAQGKISITFHPTGIKTLADELARHHKEKIA